MSNLSASALDMIYKLEDKPSPGQAIFAAVQHLTAIILSIVLPRSPRAEKG